MSVLFERTWSTEGIIFDFDHPDLPQGWRSSRFECSFGARLVVPSIARKRQWIGDGVRMQMRGELFVLEAGDRVRATNVSFGAAENPVDARAEVEASVERKGDVIHVTSARFWQDLRILGPRDIAEKMEARAHAWLPASPQAEAHRQAMETLIQTLNTHPGVEPYALQILAEAWAWAGYAAAKSEYVSAVHIHSRRGLAEGPKARRLEGDRDLAKQIIWDAQQSGTADRLNPNAVARAVLDKLVARGSSRADRDQTVVRTNILELFERRHGVSRLMPRLMTSPPI